MSVDTAYGQADGVTVDGNDLRFVHDGEPHLVRHTAFSWTLFRGLDLKTVDCGSADPDSLIYPLLGAPR